MSSKGGLNVGSVYGLQEEKNMLVAAVSDDESY